MAMIDPIVKEEIRARIDLADFIEEHGIQLKRTGSRALGCCPFHKEKTPSFNVDSDKGFYKCFGCGVSGDIFKFMQEYDGVPFKDAITQLAERCGIKIETHYDPNAKIRDRLYTINSELAAFYRRCLTTTAMAAPAREYLDSRALDQMTQEQFQIGYAPDRPGTLEAWAKKHDFTLDELVAAGIMVAPRQPGGRYYDRFHGRITFPICDVQGRVIAFSSRILVNDKKQAKYVNSAESEIFKKSHTLYALQFARAVITKMTPRQAIVCEGQIDVIRCHANGFRNAVASQGTAFTIDHVRLLKKSADSALLIFDSDKAGVKAALRTTELFLSENIPVRIVTLPEGEDPDSLLRLQGPDAFKACIAHAQDPAIYIVNTLRSHEVDPNSMDATSRIAKVLISTILNCTDVILTAKFLKDGAEILGLPVTSLEQELALSRKKRDELAQRKEAYQSQHNNVVAERQGAVSSAEYEPIDVPVDMPVEQGTVDDYASTEGLPDAVTTLTPDALIDDMIPEDGSETFDEAYDSPEASGPSLRITADDLQASRNLAEALCELLAHHFTDLDVMSCLIAHLPPSFVRDPYASKLYDLACKTVLNKSQVLSPDDSDTGFVKYLGEICVSPDRILADEETSPMIFAQQLVRRFWTREYDRAAAQPGLDPIEHCNLIVTRHRLQALPWDEAKVFMDATKPLILTTEAIEPATPMSILSQRKDKVDPAFTSPQEDEPIVQEEPPQEAYDTPVEEADIYDLL